MAQDAPSTRKEKKARRDAERQQEKGRKRKLVETIEPGEQDTSNHTLDTQADYVPLSGPVEDDGDQRLGTFGTPKTKKRRTGASSVKDTGHDTTETSEGASEQHTTQRKKRRKTKKHDTSTGVETEEAGKADGKKPRFIVFVGNLPYSTTDATLRVHFKKLEPFTLRHRVDPEKKRSKGFAFLEFDNFDRMETCLKLYHHSIFDPEEHTAGDIKGSKKQKNGGRRINVELTAGGGGKAAARMDKIRAKNVKLEEERKRRLEMEKYERSKQDHMNKTLVKGKHTNLDETNESMAETTNMHPSRLARMGE